MSIKWPHPQRVTLPLVKPELDNGEREELIKLFDSSLIGSISPAISELEDRFNAILGMNSLLVSNGSVALMLAMRSLGLGPGDKILTSSFTYAATASSIINIGAIPIFCEVDLGSWQISIDSIQRMYTPDCRAILVPHIYGVPANMDHIQQFALAHELFVIEDCAESFLGQYKNRLVGTIGDIGTFSFFPNKLITSGEGGLVISKNFELAKRMRLLRGQGMDLENRYWFIEPGYNFRMTGLQASILSVQLREIESLWNYREGSELVYRQNFQDILKWPETDYSILRSPWIFSATVENDRPSKRNLEIAENLAKKGIETRPLFYPLPTMPAFRGFPTDTIRNAKQISSKGISLPTGRHVLKEHYEMIYSAIACE